MLIDRPPEPSEIADSVRYWDKAGTKNAGAFTAGVLKASPDRGARGISGRYLEWHQGMTP